MASITTAQPRNTRTVGVNGSLKGRQAANGKVVIAQSPLVDSQDWQQLSGVWAGREKSHSLSQRLATNDWLDWGWLPEITNEPGPQGISLHELAALEKATPAKKARAAQALANWLEEHSNVWDAVAGLEWLGWAHTLPLLVAHLEPLTWQAALAKLLQAAQETLHSPSGQDLLTRQLWSVELPATLAYWFPEIGACQQLASAARDAALALIEEAVDAEGVIHAEHVALLRPLLASWIRLAAMEQSSSRSDRPISSLPRLQKCVSQALRLTRPDGSQTFAELSSSNGKGAAASFFRAALRFGGEPARRIAAWALPTALEPGRRTAANTRPRSKRPTSGFNSELSQLALLSTGWAASDPRLAVAYDNERVRCELSAASEVLWSGQWNPEVARNGEPLKPVSGWEEVCWVSDEDVDYLELEISLMGGVRIQRHLLLARQDQFLFLADAVLGEEAGQIAYRSSLPLPQGVQFAAAKESHEGKLIKQRAAGLVLPLALPEWRSASGAGALTRTSDGLELRLSAAKGRALFAPLFVDLARRRFSHPFTWRRLTVAENRQILPSDLAVGYRVQVGAQQWLFYRSLGERGNRTLLGHNLVSEFLAARFNWEGITESLLEIEG